MSLEKQTTTSANLELKRLIEDFLALHPSLTVNALATRSGVPGTSLRRILQDEMKSEVAPHTALSLVSYIKREKKISKLLATVEGELGDFLRKNFSQFVFEEEKVNHSLDQGLNDLFKDKYNYLIYKLASNVCGVSSAEVRDNFGLTGLNKLEAMIAENFIYEKDGRYHSQNKNFSVDIERALELTHSLVDQFKVADVNKGHNLFYSLSEGLNEAGIKKVKEIELYAVKKVFEVMNDNEFIGSIPYFSVIISDVLGITPNNECIKEVLQ